MKFLSLSVNLVASIGESQRNRMKTSIFESWEEAEKLGGGVFVKKGHSIVLVGYDDDHFRIIENNTSTDLFIKDQCIRYDRKSVVTGKIYSEGVKDDN